jgi:uncharacterized membrane protein YcaP (DUF421 family)
MPAWLVGQTGTFVGVAGKALLMYGTAVIGLRIAHRRTLSQWSAIDFAAAVAIGAVMGRTAVAEGQSFLVGAVALITFLAAHSVVTLGRGNRWIAMAVDHRVRVLVHRGRLRRRQLRICGLTENDVVAQLRELGIRDLQDLRYVLYETKGQLTVVPETSGHTDGPLVRTGLSDAAGFDIRELRDASTDAGSPP